MDNYEEKYKKALAWMQSLYKGLHGKTKEEAEEAFPELKDEGREEKEMLDWIISYLEGRALNAYIVQERENLNKAVKWLRNQSKVSVDNDLQSEINILSKRYPEVSFAKLSRIAVHIANWQKQQIAKENMLLPFKEYDNLMDSVNRRKKEGYEAGYKQGSIDSESKQKPADKVEPKFKVGDWVTNGRYTRLIVGINSDCPYYMFKDGTSKRIKDIDKKYYLWTIQDAKDGDILISFCKQPFIYNGKFTENVVGGYYGLDVDGNFIFIEKSTKECNWTCNENIKPATKEQRDLLFQKMADAGYTFDFEKKELKKIKQKSAWSEEDETTKNNISHIIRQYDKISKRENKPCWYIGDCLLWMQNIRDRVQPQPKQEWSEEDEKLRNDIIQFIEKGWTDNGKSHLIPWLKSLRPQNKEDLCKQKPTLDIEIPFGAKDSELIEETISIPEGCYVIIKDNKIIIRKEKFI